MLPLKAVNLEVVGGCNLDCPLCPAATSNNKPVKLMTMDTFNLFLKTMEDIRKKPEVLLWNYGEPLMHPEVHVFVDKLEGLGFRTVISTNGVLLQMRANNFRNSKLSNLIVSLDGLDQETLSQYRRGAVLENILEGFRQFKANSPRTHCILQLIAMKQNLHQVGQVAEYAKKWGFDSSLTKTVGNLFPAGGSNWSKDLLAFDPGTKLSRFDQLTEDYILPKGRAVNECPKAYREFAINTEGVLFQCTHDSGEQHPITTLKGQTFTEILASQEYRKFVSTLGAAENAPAMCRICPTRYTNNQFLSPGLLKTKILSRFYRLSRKFARSFQT
jgi:radical SAM protein with 4Fe4S-binding SPASM domain